MEDKKNQFTVSQNQFNPVDDFNPGLIVYIVNKSVIWIILIILLCTSLAFIYLRYAPRIYEATTTLTKKAEKTTEILGVQQMLSDNSEAETSREMRLMTSKLLLNRVVDSLPLQIAYYKEGKTKFVSSELYGNVPFVIKGAVKNDEIYNVPVYIKIISPRKVYMGFEVSGKEYEFNNKDTGRIISNTYFDVSIHLSEPQVRQDFSGIYFFKFLSRNEIVEEISQKLEVLPVDPRTKTISLKYTDRNPVRCKEIIETVAKEFIEYDLERKREGITNILKFIDAQIDTFGTNFDNFQDSISNMKIAEGYLGKNGDYLTQLSTKQVEFEAKYRDYKYDLLLMQTFKNLLLTNKDYASLPTMRFKLAGISFDSDVNYINDLQVERNRLLLDATPLHPTVRLLDKQIEEAKIRLNKTLDNATATLKANMQILLDEYNKYTGELLRMPDLENKFARLDKMAEIRNDFVLDLYSQKSNYMIASAGIVSDYVVLQPATIPNIPISPKETIIKIAGFAIGLMLGLVLIVVRYLLHNTIVSVEDVTRKTPAAMLGVIPSYKDELERSQIVVTQDPKSTITEAFRGVRSNLQFIASQHTGPRIISTTSTIPGEGKTFVSLNIAAILSMLDKRIIILDFDMRKPRLDKVFAVDSYKGISTILSGQTGIDECIMASGIPNLDFITSGPVPPNPSELILLPTLNSLLEHLKKSYDYIIIDTPPIGLVTDALEILKICDYPIYVLRAAYSNKGFVQNINRIITENKIQNLSVIINDFGRGASGYGTYSTYGNYYGYGYGYGYYGTRYGDGYYTNEEEKNTSLIKKLLKK